MTILWQIGSTQFQIQEALTLREQCRIDDSCRRCGVRAVIDDSCRRSYRWRLEAASVCETARRAKRALPGENKRNNSFPPECFFFIEYFFIYLSPNMNRMICFGLVPEERVWNEYLMISLDKSTMPGTRSSKRAPNEYGSHRRHGPSIWRTPEKTPGRCAT